MNKALLILPLFSAFVGLAFILYPLLVYLRALFVKKPVNRSETFREPVSIIIAAYNEETFIREKLLFFLNEEEWIPGSEIIIISAGSTDNTNSILNEFSGHPCVRPILISGHLNKPQALNLAVPLSRNKILMFSDCRQRIKKGSVAGLVSYFNDDTIGTVNSTIHDTKNGGKTSIIRSILNSICLNESTFGSSLNVHGALYAQRRNLFRPFPENIVFDDLYATVSTIVQGKRLIQSPEAIIYDIHFNNYYRRNRIERSARGLIIFLAGHWTIIKKMPLPVLLRFLAFRYLKLLLPFLLLSIAISLACSMPLVSFAKLAGCMLAIILIMLLNVRSRQFLLTLIRVNIYFLSAMFKFFILKERKLGWEKLSTELVL